MHTFVHIFCNFSKFLWANYQTLCFDLYFIWKTESLWNCVFWKRHLLRKSVQIVFSKIGFQIRIRNKLISKMDFKKLITGSWVESMAVIKTLSGPSLISLFCASSHWLAYSIARADNICKQWYVHWRNLNINIINDLKYLN